MGRRSLPTLRWKALLALLAAPLCLLTGCGVNVEGTVGVPTSFGDLRVWEFGSRGKGKVALAMHGGMNGELVHREFFKAAQNISHYGYYTIVPNFHSLRSTSPGTLTDDQMEKLLLELLAWSGAPKFSMLLGKGWGGGMAGAFASRQADKVERLVLVAPGALAKKSLPAGSIEPSTMLLWTVGDSSVSLGFMDTVQGMVKNAWRAYSGPSGASLQHHEWIGWIQRFARWKPGDSAKWGPAVNAPAAHDEL